MAIYAGTPGDDIRVGGPGDDVLWGGLGDDQLSGLAGDDKLEGGPGADVLKGGSGTDIANYVKSPAAVHVDLAGGASTGGDAEGDVLTEIEDVWGSPFDDQIIGNSASNRLFGNAGNDLLAGGAGSDLLDGGEDDGLALFLWGDTAAYVDSDAGVTIDLAAGTARGGHAEGDTLKGIESVLGSNHADTLTARNDDPDTEDVLEGSTLVGLEGADTLLGGSGDDWLLGEEGADTLSGRDGDDWLLGGEGADTLRGDDRFGAGGADTLDGGEGADRLDGGDGDDWLLGGEGADTLRGGGGDDWLFGGEGADTLRGEWGDDWLLGGEGADTLWGGAGADLLFGGKGADTFGFSPPLPAGWEHGGDRDDFEAGHENTILDFENDFDKIAIPGFGLTEEQLRTVISSTADTITVDLTQHGGGTIIIENHAAAGVEPNLDDIVDDFIL